MTQSSLWQQNQSNLPYAELCNALYERELGNLALQNDLSSVQLSSRIKSLPYYVQRTAYRLIQAQSPLHLDILNASWSDKQANKLPVVAKDNALLNQWYQLAELPLGLVIPVKLECDNAERIVLDSIDRIDLAKNRMHGNFFGWFNFNDTGCENGDGGQLLKPTKKVMSAACCGHQWSKTGRFGSKPLSLRELLLTCSINWKQFKKTA